MFETSLPEAYYIIEKLGKGGFGETYLCLNKENKKCVIKYISFPKEDKKFIELAILEAKVLKSLNHKQIPKFIDSYFIENNNNIDVFLIQEYIEAKNLKQIIESGKHFNEEEVRNIALQILKIMEYIHGFLPQIIHRDIKPSNILLTENNEVFLIDFGAAKEKLTYLKISESGISTIIGTQGYMPIEQFEGKAIPASDIYSLGLTLLYLLSHLEPLQISKNGLTFNFKNRVNISDNFYNIIEKMINPDWKERYRSVLQIKSDLQNIKKEEIEITGKEKSDSYYKEMIREKLNDDEIVYFNYRLNLKSIFRQNTKYIVFLISPFVIILLIAMLNIWQIFYIVLLAPMPSILTILFLIGWISFFRFFYLEVKAQTKEVFYITNKRIICSQIPDNTNFNFFNYRTLKNFTVEKKVYKDGSGDLLFYNIKLEKVGRGQTIYAKDIKLKITGFKDLRRAEKLILKEIYKDPD